MPAKLPHRLEQRRAVAAIGVAVDRLRVGCPLGECQMAPHALPARLAYLRQLPERALSSHPLEPCGKENNENVRLTTAPQVKGQGLQERNSAGSGRSSSYDGLVVANALTTDVQHAAAARSIPAHNPLGL